MPHWIRHLEGVSAELLALADVHESEDTTPERRKAIDTAIDLLLETGVKARGWGWNKKQVDEAKAAHALKEEMDAAEPPPIPDTLSALDPARGPKAQRGAPSLDGTAPASPKAGKE